MMNLEIEETVNVTGGIIEIIEKEGKEKGMTIQEIPGDPQETQETHGTKGIPETPETPEEIQGETHGIPNSKDLMLLLHQLADKDNLRAHTVMIMGEKANIHLIHRIMPDKTILQVSHIHSILQVNTLPKVNRIMVIKRIQTNLKDMDIQTRPVVYLPMVVHILLDILDMDHQSPNQDTAKQVIKPQEVDIMDSPDMEAKLQLELIPQIGIMRLIIALVLFTESLSVQIQVSTLPRMDNVRSV